MSGHNTLQDVLYSDLLMSTGLDRHQVIYLRVITKTHN